MATGEQYSILPAGPLLLDRTNDFGGSPIWQSGTAYVFADANSQANMYNLLSFTNFATQTLPKVDIAANQFVNLAALVNGGANPATINRYNAIPNSGQIQRFPAPNWNAGNTLADALALGALAATADPNGNPQNYSVIK